MRKVVIAVTGASGSIYAQLLINKLKSIKSQWVEDSNAWFNEFS
jgi:3-polyprenyl-4-hydroxybenzoate decarboxylase